MSRRFRLFLPMFALLGACEEAVEQRAGAQGAGERMQFAATLFSGAEQADNFHRLAQIFPHTTITASPSPQPFPLGARHELPAEYAFRGETRATARLLEDTDTAALLVIRDGAIVYENYWLTGGPNVNWSSFSVGKSFVSALIGIAVADGLISSIDEPITRYVPELAGSAYDEVRIKDVLQMSSGARWNEDYSDPESDINRFVAAFGTGASLDEFAATLVRERAPGTVKLYNSSDTQALGMLLARATGTSLSRFAEEKLFHPLGMEGDSYWITDDPGVEMAAGGLQMTARDFAKLGQLYLDGGEWRGRRIVPAQWVHDSVTPDAPHLMPGADPEFPVGYGYQWWVPDGDAGEFSAIGIYNQFVYVHPGRDLVIVKLSAFAEYSLEDTAEYLREIETIELFRAIGASLDQAPTRDPARRRPAET